MNVAVAIFVKTPGLSPVKTRLARTLGRHDAEQCYQRSVACVAAAVRASRLSGYWAVAETEGRAHPLWREFPVIEQGEGGLGERMHAVYSALLQQHEAVMLLGADAPQLQAAELLQAASWLRADADRYVLGPARDGGFWLFGGNRPVARERWLQVAYSRADTAVKFEQSLAVDGWRRLALHSDLDEARDLVQVRAELLSLADPLPAQHALLEWLERAMERAA
ncbi:MAG: DUF2064 domain-containing protein [Wenzhouxiangellaceae bacterium]|nr:DUF2064 domain-containing protein [Wenzhouxiangellaceae bacterium]